MISHILIVDDQESIRHFIAKALKDEGYQVTTAGEGKEGLKSAEKEPPDLVLLDLRLPDMHGLDVLRELKATYPELTIIIMTAFGDVESAVSAMKLGAFDYVTKPVNLEQLSLVVAKGLESQKLWRELKHHRQLQHQKYSKDFVRGNSPKIHHVYDMCEQVAKSDSTSVLIQGESGTGKELVANMVHELSSRRDKPFLEINCAAIPREILESELFGHEKGAFTDARAQKQGLLELANGGTLFLDEVGEMSLTIQVKLLRVLERMTFKRVGGTKDIKVSVRIISATNQDLQRMVDEGKFREDLFYRLKVVPIMVPPLRDRREDILLLAKHFMYHFSRMFNKNFQEIAPDAQQMLINYDWPGNIRELKNLMERTVLLENGPVLTGSQISLAANRDGRDPDSLIARLEQVIETPVIPTGGIPFEELVADIEQTLIRKASDATEWNQSRTAQVLNLKRDKLRYRMKLYNLQREKLRHREVA
jgi:two-component system, NtrC family, response regulator AtoC